MPCTLRCRVRHSFSSCNMEFRYPPSPPPQNGSRGLEREEQQSEILSTTEETRPTSLSLPENHHSAYNISIVDERKSCRELQILK